jgi:seryl-tRNA synthetase
MDEILEEAQLPLLYTAYTPCFRREKMSAGRDVRGIKRGHQFDKVEMYMYAKPEESDALHEKMLADAEATCAALGFTYRVKQLCTGDLGFQSRLYANLAVAYCALTQRCDDDGLRAAQSAFDLDRQLGQTDSHRS